MAISRLMTLKDFRKIDSVPEDATRSDDWLVFHPGGPFAFMMPRDEVDATIAVLERGGYKVEAKQLRDTTDRYDQQRAVKKKPRAPRKAKPTPVQSRAA